MRFVNKNSAFTLIEIVVVIGIMAVLSVIVYSSFDASKAQSRDQKRISDINLIKLSLEDYSNKNNGLYPVSLNDLVPTFIAAIPTPPGGGPGSTGYGYNYFPIAQESSYPGVCTSYQLWTTLEGTSQYLSGKKGFDSTDQSVNQCSDQRTLTVTRVNASTTATALIYDVTP